MEPAELSTTLKPFFTQRAEKSVEGKPYSRNTVRANSFLSGQNFFLVLFKESRFPLFGISIQAGKRSSRSITERSCATGIDFFYKAQASNFQRRPWSPAANQLGMNASERFSNLACFNTISTSERETVKTNARWTRWPFAQNNNKPAEVLHLKARERRKSVHLQALHILHILCFTDANSQTETHFFLVKFLSSSSEYMNQTRQVFEFLIQGALRE